MITRSQRIAIAAAPYVFTIAFFACGGGLPPL